MGQLFTSSERRMLNDDADGDEESWRFCQKLNTLNAFEVSSEISSRYSTVPVTRRGRRRSWSLSGFEDEWRGIGEGDDLRRTTWSKPFRIPKAIDCRIRITQRTQLCRWSFDILYVDRKLDHPTVHFLGDLSFDQWSWDEEKASLDLA